jgi:prephenate dehydrogenase
VLGFGRTARNLQVAQSRGLIDRIVTDVAEAADVDLIVLAAPVRSCAALAARFRAHARATTILTDVASVKASLVADLEAVWDPSRVVGAHPIAGSEASGAGAARADLFARRLCILTPGPQTDPAALALLRALWEGVGARVEAMPAATHDAILARVSHLPHVVAYALVRALASRTIDGRSILDYAGSGLLDVTRIAASPAEIWRDIALTNRPALTEALREFGVALDDLARLIERDDAVGLERALQDAAQTRQHLVGKA